MTINELVNQALVDYAHATDMDEASYHDAQTIEALNESRELDPTGLTTALMLRGLLDHFMENTTFSAASVLREPQKFAASIASIQKVLASVDHPEIQQFASQYQKSLRETAKIYGVSDLDAFDALVENKYDLAFIRRDALRSMQTLEAFQFSRGKGESGPLMFNRHLFEFFNINSLLRAAREQRIDGVSLCLIRDPAETMASYFVFAIRNGENIVVLTDREPGPHPMYVRMSRRPDRQLQRRAARNWFPYHALSLTPIVGVAPDGSEYEKGLKAEERTQLVRYNTHAVKLKSLGELYPEEVMWISLMFELIAQRYGKEFAHLPELAYTGEMLVDRHALVGAASAMVLAGDYLPLEVAPLQPECVTDEATSKQWEHKPTTFNDWLLERYSSQVPAHLLNLVGGPQKVLAGPSNDVEEDFGREQSVVEYEALSPVTFGTVETLEADRLWTARVNQCREVQRLADLEYDKTVQGVISWCRERVKANREFLLDATSRGELLLPTVTIPDGDAFWEHGRLDSSVSNAVKQYEDRFFRAFCRTTEGLLLGTWPERRRRPGYLCADHPDITATIFTEISPTCPEALAIVFGVGKDGLPWPLQHWFAAKPYVGNSILRRLDPKDWVLKNPYRKLNLTVHIALSKTAVQERRRKLGLARADFQTMRKRK